MRRTERTGWLIGRESLIRSGSPKYLWGLALLFFGLFFYLPLGKLLTTGVGSHFWSEVFNGRTLNIIWFTVWQAGVSALLSLVLGIPSAYVFYVRRYRFQRVFRALISVPFMLPSIVVAIAFTSIISGVNGTTVIILANTFMNYSIAVRVIGSAWRHLDPLTSDASELDGAGRLRNAIQIVLPQIKGSIASVGILIFLYCSANFGIVMVLGNVGTKTIETEIYTSATSFLNLHRSAALVLVQLGITFLTLFISGRLVSRSLTGDLREKQLGKNVDRRDIPVVLLVTFTALFLIVTPMLSLLIRAFQSNGRWGITNFQNLATHGARDLLSISVGNAELNSLRNALVTVFLSLLTGVLISYLLAHARLPHKLMRSLLDAFFLAPIGISSVILGFGFLVTFGEGVFPLRSSWLVTPIAQSLLAIPLVVRFVYPTIQAIPQNFLEMAEMDGADRLSSWRRVQFPLVQESIYLAAGYTVVLSIGEFGAANFLAYGDQATLPTVLFQLISRPGAQNYGMAMAASLLLTLVSGFAIYSFEYLSEVRG